MEFCSKCGKLLLPKDNKLYCTTCKEYSLLTEEKKKEYERQEDVSNKNDIIVADDRIQVRPTVKGLCFKCGNRELEWWMIQMRKADEAETRFYRCTKCGNTWRRSG